MTNATLKIVIAGAAILALASPVMAKAHDQGIGDGSGLGRTLEDLGTSNAGGSGQFVGGKGGVSGAVKSGMRGDAASTAKSNNKGAHGSVAGSVDDVVRK